MARLPPLRYVSSVRTTGSRSVLSRLSGELQYGTSLFLLVRVPGLVQSTQPAALGGPRTPECDDVQAPGQTLAASSCYLLAEHADAQLVFAQGSCAWNHRGAAGSQGTGVRSCTDLREQRR